MCMCKCVTAYVSLFKVHVAISRKVGRQLMHETFPKDSKSRLLFLNFLNMPVRGKSLQNVNSDLKVPHTVS
jgi:hypothetical protein